MRLKGKFRLAVGWLVVTGLCGYFELQRLMAAIDSPAGPLAWFSGWDPETTLPFLVLLALPVICLLSGAGDRDATPGPFEPTSRFNRVWGCGLVFCLSLGASSYVGLQPVDVRDGPKSEFVQFYKLPPAYHDEYSYLLQAETFAAGRLSWPAVPGRPDLFHQVHVLNETRTASRYFPWTGTWIAMFLRTGNPVIGHWLAGALAAVFFYLAAAEFLGPRTALAAGLLIGCSPGLAVFSNLLLAHHPTMLALGVFLWTMIRLLQRPSVLTTLICGVALSLAMLGRPMTAAGFALPWGVVLLWNLVRCPDAAWTDRRVAVVTAMALPLVAGFAVLGVLNHSITGRFTRSAYQEYTDVYTPRHAYGFNNGTRGDAQQSPKVLKSYDQWAENLTWPLAIRNVGYRCLASAQWILGIAPIVAGLLLAFLRILAPGADSRFQSVVLSAVLASVVSLHVVHVPYWFTGIMHWHYVFETAPLVLILVAAGLATVGPTLASLVSARLSKFWLMSFLAAALLPAWVSADATWGSSKIESAVSELGWSRRRFEQFRRLTTSPSIRTPALVLVDESNSDPQLSYIINDPEYRNDVLVARFPATSGQLVELKQDFPDRALYRFDPQTFLITPLAAE